MQLEITTLAFNSTGAAAPNRHFVLTANGTAMSHMYTQVLTRQSTCKHLGRSQIEGAKCL